MAKEPMGLGSETFASVWADTIFPAINADFEALLSTMPLRLQAKKSEKQAKEKEKEEK